MHNSLFSLLDLFVEIFFWCSSTTRATWKAVSLPLGVVETAWAQALVITHIFQPANFLKKQIPQPPILSLFIVRYYQ